MAVRSRAHRNMETRRPGQTSRTNAHPPSVFCQARLRAEPPGILELAEKLWRSILVRRTK